MAVMASGDLIAAFGCRHERGKRIPSGAKEAAEKVEKADSSRTKVRSE
jgi:hypothetical protein